MKNETKLLTALGCSSSLALTLMAANPASAMPADGMDSEIVQSEIAIAPVTHVQDNLLDELGCGCAVCNMSQPETM
ncbi:hypothetical protein IQ235_14920 [Oscillatoriales cyanobacterium LEGE 11467]|uniref:Secreted protein n=1 Tax=Zarconia navalis LEGE 11467 TaxID=1828826 RepID=A0A928ZAW8_9CYAN|nr:hypothetical protein [Zarconia navalis]MBE9042071.1 hypothetical protein [Zarconia navalis LEGE 11467]